MLGRSLACFVLLSAVASSGCSLYDDDDPCLYPADQRGGADIAPELSLRNPYTGQCESYGGTPPCDPACGPCPDYAESAVAQPSWGLCQSQCTGLEERTCLSQSGCRGVYAQGPEDLVYLACWATDMSGPIQGGSCEGLDALECSRHDDCAAVHETGCDFADGSEPPSGCEPTEFSRCASEPEDVPYTGTCYGEVLCESLPPECPDDTMPGIANGCWTGYCIPLEQCESQPACGNITEEASCVARPDCSALYEGVDCVCDESGCACAEWVFDRCE